MKKVMTLFAIAAMGVAMVSCSSNDDMYDADLVNQTKSVSFKEAFINAFGQPAANQAWGFDNQSPIKVMPTDVNDYIVDFGTSAVRTRGQKDNGKPNIVAHEVKTVVKLIENEEELVLGYFNTHTGDQLTTIEPTLSAFHISLLSHPSTLNKGQKMYCCVYKTNEDNVREIETDEVPNFQNDKALYIMDAVNINTCYLLNNGNKAEKKEPIFVAGSTINPSLKGMYYMAFDCDHDQAGKYEAIFRIGRAEFIESFRIIVEDLGDTSSDFDYNDVVLDVYPYELNDKYYANITVQAAGGTLPIYIGDYEKEIHAAFGAEVTDMINTNAPGGKTLDPINFNINLSSATNVGNALRSVAIKVNGTSLDAEVGQPAEKICVGTDYPWLNERVSIRTQSYYNNFRDYVTNLNTTFTYATWYK